MPLFVLSRLLSSLWASRTGSASDWCALQEALYECIDTIQYITLHYNNDFYGVNRSLQVKQPIRRIRKVEFIQKSTKKNSEADWNLLASSEPLGSLPLGRSGAKTREPLLPGDRWELVYPWEGRLSYGFNFPTKLYVSPSLRSFLQSIKIRERVFRQSINHSSQIHFANARFFDLLPDETIFHIFHIDHAHVDASSCDPLWSDLL